MGVEQWVHAEIDAIMQPMKRFHGSCMKDFLFPASVAQERVKSSPSPFGLAHSAAAAVALHRPGGSCMAMDIRIFPRSGYISVATSHPHLVGKFPPIGRTLPH